MKKQVRITNWSFGYDNPVDQTMRLYGKVYGHEYIEYGHNISSSAVVNINYKEGTVETLNTIYVLGEPNKEYSDKYDLSQFNLK